MRVLFDHFLAAFSIAALLVHGSATPSACITEAQTEELAWEIGASRLQAAGFTLPSDTPTVWSIMRKQSGLSTHQELSIEWDLIPGSEHPLWRGAVPEGSLSKSFVLLDRKQNVQGNSRGSTLTLSEMTLVTAAVTRNGEVRGLTVGPGSPYQPPESLHAKPGQRMEGYVFPKVTFGLYLPDDPKIERLVFLLSHPDGTKYRLEEVGSLELNSASAPQATPVGIFESHANVGAVLNSGAVEYDSVKKSYTIAGSGENMWFGADAFQFAWKKMSGDVAFSADISFLGSGGNAHRKAVLMIRQSLDADSVYADVALHGNGLTALQFRDEKGGATQEVRSMVAGPKSVRVEKHGAYFTMWLVGPNGKFEMAGGSPKIELKEPFYVGIGVCSHQKDVVERAVFSKVEITTAPVSVAAKPAAATLYSVLETVPIDSGDRTAVYISAGRFEAPNWTRDGRTFLFNREGKILRLSVNGGTPETIDTGFANKCNNDHGISPDSTLLAISDQSQEEHKSIVYVVPMGGGAPRRLTKNSPSYWHGWSPEGKTLAFVGQRNGDFDIYTIPVAGGDETRLTTAPGLDDGPEYSPDGQYIYFNSERTGHMQIWRMKADGSEQTQVFSDDYNNWFPHISPDGKWMVFLSFDKSVNGHPENKDVMLRLMPLSDGKIKVLAKLFGGQGTNNVPSWSPDSKSLAFVSYAIVPGAEK
jgi:TolB protein